MTRRIFGSRSIVALTVTAAGFLSGCAQLIYSRFDGEGVFEGDLDLKWKSPDLFVYVPGSDPLRFKRGNGTEIRLGRMYTDGGSIPRFAWIFPQFSPWGLAKGYIIHDWLFHSKHCGLDSVVSFEESAVILAEATKTMMRDDPSVEDPVVAVAIYEAVQSPIARNLWNSGTCQPAAAVLPGANPPSTAVLNAALDKEGFITVLRVRDGRVTTRDK